MTGSVPPMPKTVVFALLAGLTLKVLLILTALGSNDVMYFLRFAEEIREHGSTQIYVDDLYYNHPPLISAWLQLVLWLSGGDHVWFARLIHVPAILADVASVLFVWRLTRHQALAMLVGLHPVLIMVSGFHGNNDPVLAACVLGAAWLVLEKRKPYAAAVVIGLAINIKLVPILAVPAFFFALPLRVGVPFGLIAVGVGASGYVWHVLQVPDAMLRNVFGYAGSHRVWGFAKQFSIYDAVGRYVLFGGIIAVTAFNARRLRQDRVASLKTGLALTFLTFLVVTPGFGIQYLAWLAAPSVLLGGWFPWAYAAAAGWFQFRVYTWWSQGFPWYYANSDLMHEWRGSNAVVDTAVWALLCFALTFHLARIANIFPKPRRTAGLPSHKATGSPDLRGSEAAR